MENSLYTTLIKNNIIITPNPNNINITKASYNNYHYNNITTDNTLIKQPLLENNNYNTNISSEILTLKTSLNQNKIFTINSTINIVESKNTKQTTKKEIPLTTYHSTYNNIKNINNIVTKQTIINAEKEPMKNKTVYNNLTTEIINKDNVNISKIINNTIIDNYLNELNISNTSNITNNQSKSLVTIPLINKTLDTKLALSLAICLPIILVAIIIILICYCIKRKKKLKMNSINNNYDLNRIKFQNSGVKQPYNKLQNTSGINVNMNANNMSMSEIKVQNLKDEIHNIITNSSGGSNSSGRRKREKKRAGGSKNNKNNNSKLSGQEGNKVNQNKQQSNQYASGEIINI